MTEFFIYKTKPSYKHTSITGSNYPKGKEKLQIVPSKPIQPRTNCRIQPIKSAATNKIYFLVN
jgi:hypothetical protein